MKSFHQKIYAGPGTNMEDNVRQARYCSWHTRHWAVTKVREVPGPPVLEEVGIDADPRIFPLDVEVQGVGDWEVAIVDDEHVADVDLDLDKVGLNREQGVAIFLTQ